jgi:flotillin
MSLESPLIIGVFIVLAIIFLAAAITRFLTNVEAGSIRLVTKIGGKTTIYKGPGKALEIPILTTGTTIPSKAINIDLDIADQTADVDTSGVPKPIKVRVLASAIVSVGDSDEMILTAANKFFAKSLDEQNGILSDLLTSTGRRAINLLSHDELFSAGGTGREQAEEDDRLAIIIKGACSRELQDLGLVFNSLNIKEVQSEVAEARRRQSAVEAKANADIVTANQERRAKEAQIMAEQAINDKQRDLESRMAENAALVAEMEAKKQTALGLQREAELKATQIAQANADGARLRIASEAQAAAEAVKIRALGEAQADAIRAINAAIREGGDSYLALKQLEMLPQITPEIARALAQSKMININSGGGSVGGAAGDMTNQITGVIQTLLATQLVNTQLRDAIPVTSELLPQEPMPQIEKTPVPVANFDLTPAQQAARRK